MAKIIRHNGQFAHYEPGVIYDIGFIDPQTNTRIPFYVGETSDPETRLKAHQREGANADEDSRLVYQAIKGLNDAGIIWTMEILATFGEEGPTDLEDEWIMKHLYDGYKLKNMKKGNANWIAERESCAADMRKRSISSYKKYREVITQEELDRKHADWMRKEEEKANAWLEEATKQAKKSEAQRRAHEFQQQIEAEMAQRRAQQVKENEEKEFNRAKKQAEYEAQWEVERPAREARLKAEAEAKLKAEIERQAQWAKEEQLQRENREEWIKRLLVKENRTQNEMVQVSKYICQQIKTKANT